MRRLNRRRKEYNNLFNPNSQGLSTYDLTYVTAIKNKKKTIKGNINKYA